MLKTLTLPSPTQTRARVQKPHADGVATLGARWRQVVIGMRSSEHGPGCPWEELIVSKALLLAAGLFTTGDFENLLQQFATCL